MHHDGGSNDNTYVLDCKKLEVYQLALKFVAESRPVVECVARGNSNLINQFKRASMSTVLNIAEGAGRTKKADKQRFYSIARGSAMESAAVLDLFLLLGLAQANSVDSLSKMLERIVSMLTRLCHS